MDILSDFCRNAGFVVRKEVLVREGTKKRMDIVIYMAASRKWFDVSLTNPTAPSVVKKAAKAQGHAADLRAKAKRSKWDLFARNDHLTSSQLF